MFFRSRFPQSVRSGNFQPRRGLVSKIIGIIFVAVFVLVLTDRYTSIGSDCSVPGQRNIFGSKPMCSIVFAEVKSEWTPITSNKEDPHYPLVTRGIRLNSLTITPQTRPHYKDLTINITNTSSSHKWVGIKIFFLDASGKKSNSNFSWAPVSMGASQTLTRKFTNAWVPTGKFGYALEVQFAI
jgi:hypothetical protein